MQVGKHIQCGSGWGCACVDVADSESRRIACFMRGLNQRLTRINRQALMSADGTLRTSPLGAVASATDPKPTFRDFAGATPANLARVVKTVRGRVATGWSQVHADQVTEHVERANVLPRSQPGGLQVPRGWLGPAPRPPRANQRCRAVLPRGTHFTVAAFDP